MTLHRLDNLKITEVSAVTEEDGGPANQLPYWMVTKAAGIRRPSLLAQVRKAIADSADDLLDVEPEVILKSVQTYGPVLTILLADGSVVIPEAVPTAKSVRDENRRRWESAPDLRR